MTRKWEALLQWYGHLLVLGFPIPKTLVIWVSPLIYITLAIWVRVKVWVTGDTHITRILGTGVPICISPWQHAKIYTLPLPSLLPFCCRARAFSISQTRLSRLSLEQASFHDLEPRHHFIRRRQLHRKSFCKNTIFHYATVHYGISTTPHEWLLAWNSCWTQYSVKK